MKIRQLLLLFVAFVIFAVSVACGTQDEVNRITTKDTQAQTHFDNLPFSIAYEDSSFQVEKFDVYSDVNNYVHSLYCILTLDVSNLSDKQINFLYKEDLDISGSFKYKDENINLTRVYLTYFTDIKKLKLYYVNSPWAGKLRDSVSGSEYAFRITTKSDPMDKTELSSDAYIYSGVFNAPFKSSDNMSKTDENYFIDGLESYGNTIKGILD